ncbi:HAMP domain-containing sensor histidine kinase [Planifilum fimeticola]
MKGNRLTRIQWRITRFALWVCLAVSALVLTAVLVYYRLDPAILWAGERFSVPLILLVLLIVVAVGSLAGYWFGNQLKKRLENLLESALKYERGQFSHRIPPLGDDEIGRVAEHLNRMARRVEQQVASLQKLTTERARWQEQMKQSVVTEERQRLARELHDAVSQQLFAVSMLLSAVRENLPEDHPVHGRIATAEKVAGDAQNEMRALLMQLRPATLEGKGLKEGLKELLAELKDKQPLKIEWEIADLPDLPKGIEDHLFRIVQESLSNVLRHSRATSVTLRLVAAPRQIHLKIVDNGVGFDMNKVKRTTYGLQSIQERANEIGGVAEVISFPGKGTQVDVKIPLVDEEGEQKP